jgi:hypothetical protein
MLPALKIALRNSESVFDSLLSSNASYETTAAVASRQSTVTASEFYMGGSSTAVQGPLVEQSPIVYVI